MPFRPSLPRTRWSCRPTAAQLTFTYDTRAGRTGITALLNDMRASGIGFNDLDTTQSSLEDIFVDLVRSAK